MELLEVFDLQGNRKGVMSRQEYYDCVMEEYREGQRITRQVMMIALLLMNSRGKLYVQQRSWEKGENPGLFDKSIEGHVPKGESPEMALLRECTEELGFPLSVVSKEEFDNARPNLSIVGIAKKLATVNNHETKRALKQGGHIFQPVITHLYVGYYDGPIEFRDGESIGVLVLEPERLEKDFATNPDKYTEDLRLLFKQYKYELVPRLTRMEGVENA